MVKRGDWLWHIESSRLFQALEDGSYEYGYVEFVCFDSGGGWREYYPLPHCIRIWFK